MDKQVDSAPAAAVTPIENAKKIPKKKRAPKIAAGNPDDWNPTQIQNDIIDHIDSLYQRGELENEYPSIFGGFRRGRLLEMDRDTIFKIDAVTMEVYLVAPHDFEHVMQDFYRRLFYERYLGRAMSVGTQNSTTSSLIRFLPELSPDQIKIFAFPGEQVYAWRRLDFTLLEPGLFIKRHEAQCLDNDEPARPLPSPQSFEWALAEISVMCPGWHSIISRCGNARAFVAWLGSLMDRDCPNRQFVYMYGKGGDGKGTIGRALQNIFGPKLTHSENIPDKRSPALRFFNASLEGKLLLIAPDQGEEDLYQNPTFMSVTGGDPLAVERKGKDTRNAVNHARVFVASNYRLKPSRIAAHTRRGLLVTVAALEAKKIAGFEHQLVDEAMFFFSIAHWVYQNMPNKVEFEQDQNVYDENTDAVYDGVIDAIDEYFILTPRKETERLLNEGTPKNQLPHMRVNEFEEYLRTVLPNFRPNKIRELLETKFDISASATVLGTEFRTTSKCLIGVEPAYPERIISRVMKKCLPEKI